MFGFHVVAKLFLKMFSFLSTTTTLILNIQPATFFLQYSPAHTLIYIISTLNSLHFTKHFILKWAAHFCYIFNKPQTHTRWDDFIWFASSFMCAAVNQKPRELIKAPASGLIKTYMYIIYDQKFVLNYFYYSKCERAHERNRAFIRMGSTINCDMLCFLECCCRRHRCADINALASLVLRERKKNRSNRNGLFRRARVQIKWCAHKAYG